MWLGRISLAGAIWLVIGVMVLATLAPAALPNLETYGEVLDGAFFGAAIAGIALVARYALIAFWTGTAKVREKWAPAVAWFLGRTAVVWLVLGASAAMADPPEIVPTPVPANVVIVPFDADDPAGQRAGTRAGAMSVLTGVAATTSAETGQPVDILPLLDGD